MALSDGYPYVLEEYARDFNRWAVATRVSEERHGGLLALALGGGARTLVDDVSDATLRDGGVADFGDGPKHHSGVEFVFRALLTVSQRTEKLPCSGWASSSLTSLLRRKRCSMACFYGST